MLTLKYQFFNATKAVLARNPVGSMSKVASHALHVVSNQAPLSVSAVR